MAGALDLAQRGLTGLEPRAAALRLDPAPLPQLSSFRLVVRHRTRWGVRLVLRSGPLDIGVPDSEQSAIRVEPADRGHTVAPGSTPTPPMPERRCAHEAERRPVRQAARTFSLARWNSSSEMPPWSWISFSRASSSTWLRGAPPPAAVRRT